MAPRTELAPNEILSPIIDVQEVRKAYGEVRAVDGISFQVAAGEIFGLLGPNGAGKTTTMEMLEGLHRPDGGQLRVLGLDVAGDATAIKERIGVQLQTAALFPQLTVEELLGLFGSFYAKHQPVAVASVHPAPIGPGEVRRAGSKPRGLSPCSGTLVERSR